MLIIQWLTKSYKIYKEIPISELWAGRTGHWEKWGPQLCLQQTILSEICTPCKYSPAECKWNSWKCLSNAITRRTRFPKSVKRNLQKSNKLNCIWHRLGIVGNSTKENQSKRAEMLPPEGDETALLKPWKMLCPLKVSNSGSRQLQGLFFSSYSGTSQVYQYFIYLVETDALKNL